MSTDETVKSKRQNNPRPAATRTQRLLIFLLLFLVLFLGITACSNSVRKSVVDVQEIITPLAEGGDPEAQFYLGTMYYTGDGVAQNYQQALKWWRKAASQGLALAQYSLGVMHLNGEGVPKNGTEAVKWYTRAAERGFAEAQINLGLMHVKGQGIPRNYEAALKWLTLAAEQDRPKAQYNLAVMYADGEGVPKDNILAYMWANLAANKRAADEKEATKLRYILTKRMTAQQIKKAQQLSMECKARNYKNC